MPAQLNHSIIWCADKVKSSEFLVYVLGLPAPRDFIHFKVVDLANGASLDYMETTEHVALQHFAFLVSEAEFDGVLARIKERAPEIWADAARTQPGEINHHDGGRGVYFHDPDGHLLEVITRPYGSGGK